MAMGEMQRQALTASELVQLTNAMKTEERLTCMFAEGAVECAQPQLRSYFAHQAARNGERQEELMKMLQTFAGTGRSHLNTEVNS